MRKNQVVLGLIGLVLLAGILYNHKAETQNIDSELFNRGVKQLTYSKHARCRMDCRRVTEAEVEEILKHGTINMDKTRLNDRPCPSFALEGYSRQDNQHLRIVFAQCEGLTRVVTCIDLDNEYTCNCK